MVGSSDLQTRALCSAISRRTATQCRRSPQTFRKPSEGRYSHGHSSWRRYHSGRKATAGACRLQHRRRAQRNLRAGGSGRSEEHTSELQSLMRISYAVFCLKKKKKKIKKRNHRKQNTIKTPQ